MAITNPCALYKCPSLVSIFTGKILSNLGTVVVCAIVLIVSCLKLSKKISSFLFFSFIVGYKIKSVKLSALRSIGIVAVFRAFTFPKEVSMVEIRFKIFLLGSEPFVSQYLNSMGEYSSSPTFSCIEVNRLYSKLLVL